MVTRLHFVRVYLLRSIQLSDDELRVAANILQTVNAVIACELQAEREGIVFRPVAGGQLEGPGCPADLLAGIQAIDDSARSTRAAAFEVETGAIEKQNARNIAEGGKFGWGARRFTRRGVCGRRRVIEWVKCLTVLSRAVGAASGST